MVSRLQPAIPGLRGMLIVAIGLPVARDLAIRAQPGNRSELALIAYLLLAAVGLLFARTSLPRYRLAGEGQGGGLAQLLNTTRSLALGLAAGGLLVAVSLTEGHPLRGMTSLATAWLIVAVSAEEFVFRGVIFVALQHLGGPVVALAGSTAAFTLAHVAADPGPSILLVLVLGAYLGILRLITSNLWAPAAAHFVIDAVSLA